MFGGAGLVAGITVGAQNARYRCICRITGDYVYIGICSSAFIVGKLSQKHGRRIGLGRIYSRWIWGHWSYWTITNSIMLY